MSGKTSRYFTCESGVRHGENLSPLLFSIFLSDLREYFSTKYNGLSFINNNISDLLNDINLDTYLKLYVLLHADDTVILAESPKELQLALDAMNQYCTLWKPKINVPKTKVLIFSRGYVGNRLEFTFGNVKLEIVRDYQYLGLIFNYNGKLNKTKQKLFEKGSRAMFSLLSKGRCLFSPLDVLLKLFNHIVVLIITYVCEIWGSENIDIIEKLQLRFLKYIINVNKFTCSNMVYGEVGTPPLIVNNKSRVLLFRSSLIMRDENNRCNKLFSILYRLLPKLHVLDVYTSPWLMFVEDTLNNIGLSGVWDSQSLPASRECFESIQVRLRDQFIH